MLLSNYHSHFELDDGKGRLDDYADYGLEHGFEILGFSPHAPLPYENTWTLQAEDLPRYLSTADKTIAENSRPMELCKGLEIDFIPGKMGPSFPFYRDLGLDYCIGSVHSMPVKETGEHISFDGNKADFVRLLNKRFRGNIKEMVKTYYELETEMISLGGFNILGHCDLIKKLNRDNCFFNQDEDWYRNEALKMLKEAAGKDFIVEVNTGGLTRGTTTEVYPSPWMLQQCLDLGIRLTVSADAHSPEHLGSHLNESLELLKKTGYSEIYFFSKGEWHPQPIDI